MEPRWLTWARKLHAIARNGLTYSDSPYEIERLNQVQDIATEILAEYTGVSMEKLTALYDNDTGYATPKVDVRGAVFRDGKILLVRERIDGGWTLPGGWADVGDSPALATEREVREESGYTVRAVKLLGLFDRNNPVHGHPAHLFYIWKTFFLCELTGGQASTSAETTDVGWFDENDIPPLSEGRTTRSQIARLFEHSRNPNLPTDFD